MESFAASDGVRLGYCIDDFTDPWKEAPVLLLLHAAMGSMRRYYAWVPRLSRHYRVVRMDLRGHGSSEIPPAERELTLERLVRDVIELMDHLGCADAHIVGNSAGGYLGQQLAMNHGERVRSLMLFGSTPGLKNSQAPSWIPQIQAKGMRAFLAETIAERLPLDQVDPGLVEWFLDEAAKNDPAYIGKFVLLMASYDWSDQLHPSSARPWSSCPARSRSARLQTTNRSAGTSGMSRCASMKARRTISVTPFQTAAPATCSISSAAVSGSESDPLLAWRMVRHRRKIVAGTRPRMAAQ